jgi:hypothetical protein
MNNRVDQQWINQAIAFNLAKWNLYIETRGLSPRPAFYAGLNDFIIMQDRLIYYNLPPLNDQELIRSVEFRENPLRLLAFYPVEFPIQQQNPYDLPRQYAEPPQAPQFHNGNVRRDPAGGPPPQAPQAPQAPQVPLPNYYHYFPQEQQAPQAQQEEDAWGDIPQAQQEPLPNYYDYLRQAQPYPPVDQEFAREDMRPPQEEEQQPYPPVDPGYAREDVRGQPPQYEQPQEEEPPQYEQPQEEEQAPEDEYVYGQQDILPEHRNILGRNGIPVIENPTPQQIAIIRRAYRAATLRLHPDKQEGNPQELALLNSAYDIIYKGRYRGFGLTTKHLLRRRRKYIM